MRTDPWVSAAAVALAVLALPVAEGAARDTNAAPVVSAHFGGNRTFLWDGVGLDYRVVVSDAEDGDTLAGTIDPAGVAIAFQYMESGAADFVPVPVEAVTLAAISRGLRLIAASDCVLCHTPTGDSPIPSYTAIARVYADDAASASGLAAKIVAGGKGVWGDTAMPPHPAFSPAQAGAMVGYILAFAKSGAATEWLPIRGRVAATGGEAGPARGPFGASVPGRHVFWAGYTDRGGGGAGPRTGHVVVRLRSPVLLATERDGGRDVAEEPAPGGGIFVVAKRRRAFIRFPAIDLTEVRALAFTIGDSRADWAGGTIEVRTGSAVGPVIGRARVVPQGGARAVRTVVATIARTRGMGALYFVFRGGARAKRGSVALGAIGFRR